MAYVVTSYLVSYGQCLRLSVESYGLCSYGLCSYGQCLRLSVESLLAGHALRSEPSDATATPNVYRNVHGHVHGHVHEHVCRLVYGHVHGHGYGHVHGNVHGHVNGHLCRLVYGHVGRHVYVVDICSDVRFARSRPNPPPHLICTKTVYGHVCRHGNGHVY